VRRGGTGATAVGRLPGGTGHGGVLAGAHEPAARPAPVPAGRGRLDGREAGPLTAATQPRARIAIDVSPLRHPIYRRIFIGNSASFFGTMFTSVAVPVQMYGLTRSTAWNGYLGLAGLVPLLVFALWGGALAD